jgi:hypothetical protein
MHAPTFQNRFLSALHHLRTPVCLDRVPDWLFDLLRDANQSQLRIAYNGPPDELDGMPVISVLDNCGNTIPLAGTAAPEVLSRYLSSLAVSLLDTHVPNWRLGAGSSGTLVLDADTRAITVHDATRIRATLRC